jgi:hypothetical protein
MTLVALEHTTASDLRSLLGELLSVYAEQGVPSGRHRRVGSVDACVRCGRTGRVGGPALEFRAPPDWSGTIVACRDPGVCTDRRRVTSLAPLPAEPMATTFALYRRSGDR